MYAALKGLDALGEGVRVVEWRGGVKEVVTEALNQVAFKWR